MSTAIAPLANLDPKKSYINKAENLLLSMPRVRHIKKYSCTPNVSPSGWQASKRGRPSARRLIAAVHHAAGAFACAIQDSTRQSHRLSASCRSGSHIALERYRYTGTTAQLALRAATCFSKSRDQAQHKLPLLVVVSLVFWWLLTLLTKCRDISWTGRLRNVRRRLPAGSSGRGLETDSRWT